MKPNLNKRLKFAIIESELTQRELSRMTGIRESQISMIVNGRMIPTISEQERIAYALNCSPKRLFE
jgi:transcriptional regulator with XRE-family HTH domain